MIATKVTRVMELMDVDGMLCTGPSRNLDLIMILAYFKAGMASKALPMR